MNHPNYYIEALTYGVSRMQTGITFNELEEHLKANGHVLDDKFRNYFRIWFLTHFYIGKVSLQFRNPAPSSTTQWLHNLESRTYDDHPGIVTAEGFEMLQDYQKLQQAKQDAKKAHNLALWAIFISIGVGIAQIILQLISMG